MKKVLPILFIVLLAVMALVIKRCNNQSAVIPGKNSERIESNAPQTNNGQKVKFDRSVTKFFFTKHARCRMKCRQITQREVKDILAKGTINYNKSDLNDPQGPTYALEGITDDRQLVRVVFAPKQQHMSVVTVIDLERDYKCDCD